MARRAGHRRLRRRPDQGDQDASAPAPSRRCTASRRTARSPTPATGRTSPRRWSRHAHRNGIKVVPWTVDDLPTMRKLIDDGVDGIITDYPDRLRGVLAERGYRLPRAYASPFDIQAHRGGRAIRPENTLPAFRERAGQAGRVHPGAGHRRDRRTASSWCCTTARSTARTASTPRRSRPGDPEFPYVGKLVHDLTLAQLRTIDCGSKTLPELPAPGARAGRADPDARRGVRPGQASGRRRHPAEHRDEDQPAGGGHRAVPQVHRASSSTRSSGPASPTGRRSSRSTGAPSATPGSSTGGSRRWRWCGSTGRPSARPSPTSARCRRSTATRR